MSKETGIQVEHLNVKTKLTVQWSFPQNRCHTRSALNAKGKQKRGNGDKKRRGGKRERWIVHKVCPSDSCSSTWKRIMSHKGSENEGNQAELQNLWFPNREYFLIQFQQSQVACSILYNLKNDSWSSGVSKLPGSNPRILFSYFSSAAPQFQEN